MVAKLKNSFLKNSFQLFCYKSYMKDNVGAKIDDELKRLSNSFPNLYNSEKPIERKSKKDAHKAENYSRSKSANGRYYQENYQANSTKEQTQTHQSLKALKKLKKKQELIILSDSEKSKQPTKYRSRSSMPDTNRVHDEYEIGNFKQKYLKSKQSKNLDHQKPSDNSKNGALSSLKISKRLDSQKKNNKNDSNNKSSNILVKNSILLQKKRNVSSANEKKAVRFADSLGLELENVITLNNQLDVSNQMKNIRLARNCISNIYNYSPIYYAEKILTQTNMNNQCETLDKKSDQGSFVLSDQAVDKTPTNSLNSANLIDFNDSKIEEHYLNRQNQNKKINYPEKVYSNGPNYYKIYQDRNRDFLAHNFENENNSLYYSLNNFDKNYKQISITTRLNNGKLESEV